MKYMTSLPRLALILGSVMLIPQQTLFGDDRFAGMDEYIRSAMETWEVPGLSIAVVKDGETVLIRHFGVCERGTDRKVSAETRFPIASCSKSFLAAALGILVDEGRLNWDDPVAKHLPGFELSDPYLTQHATLRDLLCHRTGLQRCDLLGDHFDTEEILRRLKLVPVVAPFRTKLTYSNPMYTVLGAVVEQKTGQSWTDFVQARICRPLGMASTATDLNRIPKAQLALRHWHSDDGLAARPPPTSGFYSNVSDLTLWLKLQLSEGRHAEQQLLETNTLREMHALQFAVPVKFRETGNIYAARFYGSGLGWFVQDYRGEKIVLHTGAWGSVVAMLPDKRLGVVVLSNLDLESLPALLMYDVFDAYLKGPEQTWNPDKWESVWMKHEPPGTAYLPRDRARSALEKTRSSDRPPALPLLAYAGTFESELYGQLKIRLEEQQLLIDYAGHSTAVSHWEADSFYVRAPTRLTFDWLLTFQKDKNGGIESVIMKHVGWDSFERDQIFVRRE